MKKETIKLEKQNLINTYNESCSDVKSALKKLYPDVEFEKKLAESWEEFCRIKGTMINQSVNLIDGIGTIKKINDKYLALYKLELLRDHYNGDWKPDYNNDNEIKYCLEKQNNDCSNNSIRKVTFYHYNRFLSFKTIKLRDFFLTNFKDLIEQAKDLI